MIKKLIGLSAILVALVFISGCRSTTVYNVANAPIDVAKTTSDDKIFKAIKNAGVQLGWIVKKTKPGMATAQLNVRRHMALVEITYDKKSYSINYKNSLNLKYDATKQSIHNNYNGWVQNLDNAIQVQLTQLDGN
jgi:hypothetical protein